CPVPVLTRSLAGIDTRSFTLLRTVVDRPTPFHRATENVLNPLPLTSTEVVPLPARVWSGEIAVTQGAGLTIGTREASALRIRPGGTVAPPPNSRVSSIGRPFCWSAWRPVLTLAAGTAWFMIAHVPATCGAAIDVPLSAMY